MIKELKKALRKEITVAVQVVLEKHDQRAALKITKAVTSAAKLLTKKFFKSQKEVSALVKAKAIKSAPAAKKKVKKSTLKSQK